METYRLSKNKIITVWQTSGDGSVLAIVNNSSKTGAAEEVDFQVRERTFFFLTASMS
jgi:hypothetical protein